MEIIKSASAGSFESSDVMIKVSPATSGELEIMIKSEVFQQFGDQIKAVVNNVIEKLDVKSGLFVVEDKGALDCVIQARLHTAILRAADIDLVDWETI